jgi:hypothetical protein
MPFKFDNDFVGYPSIEAVVPVPATLNLLPISPGFIALAEDQVWGPGEFIFARAGGTIKLTAGCVLTSVWDATNKVYTYNMTEWPVTATLGRPLYIYVGNTQITVGQYGWFMMTGRYPVTTGASIAADTAAGRAAAGQLAASGAGVQILGARVITPATQTFTTAMISGNVGSNQIFVQSTAGIFPGVYVSGTGVGAAAIVSFVDPLGKYILVTVVNTATPISGNLTVLYNNATIFYNVLEFNRMMAQGIA